MGTLPHGGLSNAKFDRKHYRVYCRKMQDIEKVEKGKRIMYLFAFFILYLSVSGMSSVSTINDMRRYSRHGTTL